MVQCLSLVLVFQSCRSILPKPPITSSNSRSSNACTLKIISVQVHYQGNTLASYQIDRDDPLNAHLQETLRDELVETFLQS